MEGCWKAHGMQVEGSRKPHLLESVWKRGGGCGDGGWAERGKSEMHMWGEAAHHVLEARMHTRQHLIAHAYLKVKAPPMLQESKRTCCATHMLHILFLHLHSPIDVFAPTSPSDESWGAGLWMESSMWLMCGMRPGVE